MFIIQIYDIKDDDFKILKFTSYAKWGNHGLSYAFDPRYKNGEEMIGFVNHRYGVTDGE